MWTTPVVLLVMAAAVLAACSDSGQTHGGERIGETVTFPLPEGGYPQGLAFDGTDVWTTTAGGRNGTSAALIVTRFLGHLITRETV